jgi:VIT1/CCC1 family predicted Fe2+/Mn2+ transporter
MRVAIVRLGPLAPSAALMLSVVATALVLFGVGAGKGGLAGRSTPRAGLQIAVIGLACASIAYVLGTVVPDMVGLHSLSSS